MWDYPLWCLIDNLTIIPNHTSIVLKIGPAIDLMRLLGHWINGQTIGLLVEPHDRIGLNQMTRQYDSVFIKNYFYIKLDWTGRFNHILKFIMHLIRNIWLLYTIFFWGYIIMQYYLNIYFVLYTFNKWFLFLKKINKWFLFYIIIYLNLL